MFDVGFDDLAGIYTESDDGYVRQSVVRVVDTLTPGMAVAVVLADEERSDETIDGLEWRIDTACDFLLETLQDEDGRVRQSAKRGLQDVYRGYDALEDRATIAALADELERLADEYDDKRRDHLLDSKEDAEFHLRPGGARLMAGIREFAERSPDE